MKEERRHSIFKQRHQQIQHKQQHKHCTQCLLRQGGMAKKRVGPWEERKKRASKKEQRSQRREEHINNKKKALRDYEPSR